MHMTIITLPAMFKSTRPSGEAPGMRIMDSEISADSHSLKSSGVADDGALSRPLSALATFSNLFSQVNSGLISSEPSPVTTVAVCTTLKPKPPSAELGTLPMEILMLIFQFVFEACIDWRKAGASKMVWLEDDPLSPSLFPYSLASVCVRWLHILRSVAVYWTRLVITVDSHATSLIVIQSLLQWVGDLSLQVIVTSHHDISGEVDRSEYARIRAVLDLLRPHIHHTWSLTFNVRHSSSLSMLWRKQGDASRPSVLTLTSNRFDTGSMIDLPHGYNTSSEARTLQDRMLGEPFFNDALMEQRHEWFHNINSLTIRGYATSCGSGISLHEFISTIQTCEMLERLTIEDITFINDLHPSCRFRLEVPIVSLRRITDGGAFGSLMSQCFGIRLKETITVVDCPFDGFGGRNLFRSRVSSTNLILEGMNASSAAIETLVCSWNGENLSLINCPGVSDSFLRRFPTEETPLDLRRLRIVDCENVNAGGLLALVRSRQIQSVIDGLFPGDPGEESCTALVELHVHGRGPPINAEQAVWLAEHVETFSWNTTATDGMQHSWDGSARELIVLPMNH